MYNHIMARKNILLLIIILFVAGIVGYAFSPFEFGKKNTTPNADLESKVEQSGSETGFFQEENTENNGNKSSLSSLVGDIDKENIATVLPPLPDLNRPIEFTGVFTEDSKKEITNSIKDISASLKQDSSLFNKWLDLGIFRKAIGDYGGALDAWEYAGSIRPQNSLSFSNLGVLYGYYLNDPLKAEKNFLTAITNDPKSTVLYIKIADFYIEVMDDIQKARDILMKGIEEKAGEGDLRVYLNSLGE